MTETTRQQVSVPQQRAADPTEQAVAAYHRIWQAMVTGFASHSYSVRAGVVRLSTGLPIAPFNGVWGTMPDVAAADVLEAVDECAAGDLPYNVQLRPGYPAALADALADRGLVETAAIPFMLLPDLERLRAAIPDKSDLRLLGSFADVDSTLDLLERGFGMPKELTRHGFPMRMLFLPGASTSLLRVDGVDVATALSGTDGPMCGVFNVATPAEHRGHGYGAAVTAHAALQGASQGATTAYLQSSPMGFPVYQRLGFETVELWQQWMPKDVLG